MKLVAVTSSFSDVGCSKHHKALRPAFGGETVQGNVNLIIMIQNMKMNRIRPAHFGHHLNIYISETMINIKYLQHIQAIKNVFK